MMRTFATLAAVLFALGSSPAFAQTDVDSDPEPEPTTPEPTVDPFDEFEGEAEEGPAGRGNTDGKPVQLMTRTELDDAGFEFGAQDSGKDSSDALLLALTAGTVIHGIGHFYLGDRRTGSLLLIIEGISVGLVFASSTFTGVTQNSSPWASLFAPALQAGLAGFAFSYLADIVGVLTKDDGGLAKNTSLRRGVGFQARYGLLSAVGLPMRHVIDGRLAVDAGLVYGAAATTQDVFLDFASYRGHLAIRPLRGAERLTFVAIEGHGDYTQWSGEGEFGRIGADGRVVGSFQFGDRIPHLSQFAVGMMAGFGNHWLQIAPRDTTTFELASSRFWVPFDVWSSLNVSERLNVRLGYGASDLRLVPSQTRLLGIVHTTLRYRSSSLGDISLRAEIGDGFALWLGGGLWFGR